MLSITTSLLVCYLALLTFFAQTNGFCVSRTMSKIATTASVAPTCHQRRFISRNKVTVAHMAEADDAAKGPKKKKVKDDVIQLNGKITEALPNAMFRVEVEPSKQIILATISGKIRKNMVRIVVGDSVQVELSAYDISRGRITYRNK